MTDGERAIWAAAYTAYLTKHLDHKNPPDHLMATQEGWKRWERGMVMAAVEWAWSCVGNLRDHYETIQATFAQSAADMVSVMLEKTP